MQSMMLRIIDAELEPLKWTPRSNVIPEASMVKLNMTEFGLLFIGMGANEIHRRIIADQWVERNPLLQTEP